VSDLFLTDDPPPRRSRPRWVDGLGLLAIIGGMVAVGLLGDDGPKDVPGPASTTTSTTAQPTTTRDTEATTTSTSEAPTTTTTAPVAGHLVPRLPFAAHAAVLLTTGSSVVLLDLDAARTMQVPTGATTVGIPVAHGFVLPRSSGFRVLSVDGSVTDVDDVGAVGGTVMASGARSVWVVRERATNGLFAGSSVVEVDLHGVTTGRHVELPNEVFPVGPVDAGLVVNGRETLSFVDGTTGKVRDLGTGEIGAVGGHWMVRDTCLRLTCQTYLVDTRNGRSRILDDAPRRTSYPRQYGFSPDGRWLARFHISAGGRSSLTVTRVPDGRSWTADDVPDGPFGFSPDGRLLLVIDGGDLCALETVDGTRHCTPLGVTDVQGLAVTNLP
jgi:hypothetical protein